MSDNQEANILPPGHMIESYKIVDHIGHGGFGEIYSVFDTRNNKKYAMKVELRSANRQGLIQEIQFFENLHPSLLFPEYIYSGSNNDYRYLVMELLGPSLSKMRRLLPNHRYTPINSIRLSYHMLRCIEQFHQQGFIHRDIKPGNFLIRNDETRSNPVVLTDFGLSKKFLIDTKHIPDQDQVGFVGTCKYASIHAHEGRELSRRDDLLSWFYSIVELAESRVPWPGTRDRDRTFYMKRSTRPEHLCRSLPIEFAQIYNNLINLEFTQKPDYDWIKNMLNECLRKVASMPTPGSGIDASLGNININLLNLTEGGDQSLAYDWEALDDDVIRSISAIPLKNSRNSDQLGKNLNNNANDENKDYSNSVNDANNKNGKDEGACCNIQ
ncbi:hypothetical protein M9Y10_024051 [Tritrichomonas musculus]|uniref:non-specific serine/threonine protein kinase n=1 Tax=Tritrichomonas musculus TaxID=1915356 RepID=A0ABR2KXM9_9EUKA